MVTRVTFGMEQEIGKQRFHLASRQVDMHTVTFDLHRPEQMDTQQWRL